MGQTLENGVYLPSEGERNCYAGLKTNWEILDQKVADVTALQQAVAGALHREIVESLPTTDIDPNTIYMVLSGTSATENVYNEFMYVNNAWELIGTSATDLTNYYTKAEVDGKLLLKANDSDVVHKTTDETSTGFKQFANIRVNNSIKGINLDSTTTDLDNCYSDFAPYGENKSGNIQYYTCNTDAGTANISNLPEAKAFFLTSITTRLISNSLYVKQILINSNSKTFTRYCANSTWSSWVNETDSEYVHKSGDETIAGKKTFSDNPLVGNSNTNITISNRQITANGSASTTGNHAYSYMQLLAKITYADSSSPINVTVGLEINEDAYADGKKSSLRPSGNNVTNLGMSGKRWANVYATNYYYGGSEIEFSQKFVTTDTNQTINGNKTFSKVNGVEPSSLGMPDLDNGVDISSYIDITQTSQYTAPTNGYISICGHASGTNAILVKDHDYDFAMTSRALTTSLGATTYLIVPVVKNHVYDITCSAVTTIDYAKFYPCQGNV
jgi:hypothetical protein